MTDQRDAGYDEWIAAIDRGEGYALECANGHGSLRHGDAVRSVATPN